MKSFFIVLLCAVAAAVGRADTPADKSSPPTDKPASEATPKEPTPPDTAQLEKQLQAAQTRVEFLRKEVKRLSELSAQGVIAAREVEEAKAQLKTAEEDVQAAQKRLENAKALASSAKFEVRILKSLPPAANSETRAPNPQTPTPNPELSLEERLARLEAELKKQQEKLAQTDRELSEALEDVTALANELSQLPLEKDLTTLHPFVANAKEFAGAPYRFGGTTSRGIDCSGLVMRVAQRLGLHLPHNAAAMFQQGTPIAREALRTGDLVFFRDTYKPGISHVGIYLGNNRFLHAAGTGRGVIISDLDTPKYKAKYAGARRVTAKG